MTSPILHPIAQYAARSCDDAVLRVSSSGGVFTEIARVVLSRGGVVVAAGWNRESMSVEHRCVETEDELSDLRGSKYVTSDLSRIFKPISQFISDGRAVLFVGTPCQTAAVRRRFGSPANLILCAIACQSNVPADIWWIYCQDVRRRTHSSIVDVQFRDKSHGWQRSHMRICLGDPAKTICEPLSDNFYARLFFSGWATKTACFTCSFRAGHSGADLLMGDFWGIGDVLPDLDDGKGVSCALAYTRSGLDLLHAAKISLAGVEYEQIVKGNPYIDASPTTDWIKRARFQKVYRKRGLRRAVRYAEWGPWPREFAMRGLGFVRRIVGNWLRMFR